MRESPLPESVCVLVCVYLCVCMFACVYVFVCVCVFACVYTFVCVYRYICVCVYACVCVDNKKWISLLWLSVQVVNPLKRATVDEILMFLTDWNVTLPEETGEWQHESEDLRKSMLALCACVCVCVCFVSLCVSACVCVFVCV